MTYHNHPLLTETRNKLQFVETPAHIAKATAEAALDHLYADVLPQPEIIRVVDPRRIVRMS